MFLAIALLASALFAGLGAYVADQKGRPRGEGALLGALFGPVGCLCEGLLPAARREGAGPRHDAGECRPAAAKRPGALIDRILGD